MMKTKISGTIALALVVGCLSYAGAGQSGLLKFKGPLHDSSGSILPDGRYVVRYAIYDSPDDGDVLWQSASYTTVLASAGEFECTLGETNGLPDSLTGFDRMWLGIFTGSGDESRPRPQISSQDIIWNSAEISRPPAIIKEPASVRGARNNPRFIRGGMILKLGTDMDGKHRISAAGYGENDAVNIGTSMALDLYWHDPEKVLLLGGGFQVELPRQYKEYRGSFQFVSFYGLAKVRLFDIRSNSDYFTIAGKFGYGFLFGDNYYKQTYSIGGGMHFAAGAGIVLKNLIVMDTFYEMNKGRIEWGSAKLNVQYTRVCLSLGVNIGS